MTGKPRFTSYEGNGGTGGCWCLWELFAPCWKVNAVSVYSPAPVGSLVLGAFFSGCPAGASVGSVAVLVTFPVVLAK